MSTLTWRRENFKINRPRTTDSKNEELVGGWVAYESEKDFPIWGIRYMLKEPVNSVHGKYWTVTHLATGHLVPHYDTQDEETCKDTGLVYLRTAEATKRFVELLYKNWPENLRFETKFNRNDKFRARGARNAAMAQVHEYFRGHEDDYYRWNAANRNRN